MMLAKFRHRYPQGSLVSELVKIDRGTYIVKATVQIEQVVLTTALASGATVEAAEDAAKERAIASLFLEDSNSVSPQADRQIESPSISNASSVSTVGDSALANNSNNKIVNFSKPQSESTAPFSEPIPSRANTYSSSLEQDQRHKPLEVESATSARQLDLNPVTESNPESSSNLFGDTFAVAAPITDSSMSENASFSSQSVGSPELEAMDFNEIKQKTDIEIRRLGWTKEQGRDFLMSRYGKRSRLHLKDEQLIEFLHYLENLPNPVK